VNKLTFKKTKNTFSNSITYHLYLDTEKTGYYLAENTDCLGGGYLIPDSSHGWNYVTADTLQEAKQLLVNFFNRDKDAAKQTDLQKST